MKYYFRSQWNGSKMTFDNLDSAIKNAELDGTNFEVKIYDENHNLVKSVYSKVVYS